ncbi:MAG: nucleotide exchange factor GrpE [Hyphomicrobiales bacterium]|nr:nucleotide exchange factor GrpE [Hyphomicrobiales bacterium]
MTDQNETNANGAGHPNPASGQAANSNIPGDAAHNASQPAAGEDGGEPDIYTVLEKLNAENTELKDRTLRTLAEMENLRRRTEREVADSKIYGVTNFARDMLGFADNLRRAIDNIPEEVRSVDGPMKAFLEGIEVTERDLQSRLKRQGIVRLEPQGQKFDPNMHEALFEVPDPSVPSGTVVQVVEDGYSIGERCLRPAKVGVARGGPKEAAAAAPESQG